MKGSVRAGDHRHHGYVPDDQVGEVLRVGSGRMTDGRVGIVLEVHFHDGAPARHVILSPDAVMDVIDEAMALGGGAPIDWDEPAPPH